MIMLLPQKLLFEFCVYVDGMSGKMQQINNSFKNKYSHFRKHLKTIQVKEKTYGKIMKSSYLQWKKKLCTHVCATESPCSVVGGKKECLGK